MKQICLILIIFVQHFSFKQNGVYRYITFLFHLNRFNEDCGFTCCNYREHQTHFHCMRKDCNYRFCDKTRFVQHTARHERLDTLCGKEFEGFRGVSCQRDSCELNVDLQKCKFRYIMSKLYY